MNYGQLVLGLPGSGKSTFCGIMSGLLSERGRIVEVVNLDPANQTPCYSSSISISELITHEEAMRELEIGPNGSFLYCIEFLEANVDWLLGKIKERKNAYFIFDCPGQIELYTHHMSMRNICKRLVQSGIKLAAVQLMDSQFCSEPAKFISGTMVSLSAMLQLELPHVNVLSKMDLFERMNTATSRRDTYTEVLDLNYLLESLEDNPLTAKYETLNKYLTELIHSFSLVSYQSLNITNPERLSEVIKEIDRTNGYVKLK